MVAAFYTFSYLYEKTLFLEKVPSHEASQIDIFSSQSTLWLVIYRETLLPKSFHNDPNVAPQKHSYIIRILYPIVKFRELSLVFNTLFLQSILNSSLDLAFYRLSKPSKKIRRELFSKFCHAALKNRPVTHAGQNSFIQTVRIIGSSKIL